MSTVLDEFVDESRRLLSTKTLGRSIVAKKVADSTNALAREGIQQGVQTGAVYYAEYQSAGRGRLGRRWNAESGANLMFSVVLRPPQRFTGLIAIAAAVAIRRAIKTYAGPQTVSIKWPNDILLDGLKCVGMLLEHVTQAPEPGLVLGIGINVNQRQFSPLEAPGATSLLLSTGRFIRRSELFSRALLEIERCVAMLSEDRVDDLIDEYEEHMHGRNQRVTFFATDTSRPVTGIVEGIHVDGSLQLRTTSGTHRFYAGDLTSQPLVEQP